MSGSHNRHARLSPSSSKRWVNCTQSIKLIEDNLDRIPEDTGSVYAAEGTAAHDHAERILRSGLEYYPPGFEELHHYVNYCRSITPPGVAPMVEARTALYYSPEDEGTCDYAVVTDEWVEIVDLKWGPGVFVPAIENSQLAIYAFSLIVELEDLGIHTFDNDAVVRMTIVQPRYHGEEIIRSWEVTLADLASFCRDIEYSAIQIREGRGLKFAPGEETCRWCPAKGFCEARAAALTEPVGSVDALAAFANLDHPGTLSDEQMVALHRNAKQIRGMLDDIEEHLTSLALAGRPAQGTKLVLGRAGNRTWRDEAAADTLLKSKLKSDQRYTRKLITPAQAEKLLSDKLESTRFRNRFESLVGRSDPKMVVALEDDRRPAVDAPVNQFQNLSSETTEEA